jgi:hypothetical protein
MAKLKAVKPEILLPEKPKILLSGPAGSGKTFLASGFPKTYYFDHEGSAKRPQYRKRIAENGGMYFGKEQGSQEFNAVVEEVKVLATERHDYQTAVFDSISFITNLAAAIAEEKVGSAFGADKKEAYKPMRQLLRWIEKLDMAVIFIAHSKDKWGGSGADRSIIGTTFDGYEKLEYILDLWFEIKVSGGQRICIVKKSRLDSMPMNSTFQADYLEIAKLYGGREIIEKPAEPIKLATSEQIAKVNDLLKKFNISKEDQEKWLTKVDADSFEDAPEASVAKWINFYSGKENGKEDK